jgi:hypothetical protein
MKLTAEQIQDNWNKFLSIIDEHIPEPRCSKLKAFYEQYAERIMLMPASHKKEYHNAFPGGYVDHVLRVVQCALKLNKVWVEMGVDTSTYSVEELVFASLNHDLGKMGDEKNESYIPQDDQWRRDKLGEDYKFNNQLEYMSVPDRGLHLLMSHGVIFSKNEMLAIKLHDGLYDDANKPYLMSWSPETKPRTALVFIVHQADLMAARIEFEQVWMPKLKGEVTQNNSSNFTIEKNKKAPVKTKALSNIKSEGLKSLLDNI